MIGLVALAGAAALLVGCGGGDSSEMLIISDAWVLPTPGGLTNAAVYVFIESTIDDELVGATVDPAIAGAVTLHESETVTETSDMAEDAHAGHDGMATMAARQSFVIPADEPFELAPGGRHLMLEQLAEPLIDGESFELTLEFAEAGSHTVQVDVTDDLE